MTQSELHIPDTATTANKADMLDYLADMIAELRELAKQTDCATLAGILDIARLEATLQGSAAKQSARSARAS